MNFRKPIENLFSTYSTKPKRFFSNRRTSGPEHSHMGKLIIRWHTVTNDYFLENYFFVSILFFVVFTSRKNTELDGIINDLNVKIINDEWEFFELINYVMIGNVSMFSHVYAAFCFYIRFIVVFIF